MVNPLKLCVTNKTIFSCYPNLFRPLFKGTTRHLVWVCPRVNATYDLHFHLLLHFFLSSTSLYINVFINVSLFSFFSAYLLICCINSTSLVSLATHLSSISITSRPCCLSNNTILFGELQHRRLFARMWNDAFQSFTSKIWNYNEP